MSTYNVSLGEVFDLEVALCHEFAHIVKAIAVRDPKLNAYVVSVSHDSNFCVGSLILIL